MKRILTTLMALCACVGILNAQGTIQSHTISIQPFTDALEAAQKEDFVRTVKFQKGHYWIRPNYQLFLDGAPALKVCFGFKGTRMDVYLNDGEEDICIVSTCWHLEQYNGFIATEDYLANSGINSEELQKALSFLTAIHYPLSKDTWKQVQQSAVVKGETPLLLRRLPAVVIYEVEDDETSTPALQLLDQVEQVLSLADQTEEAHADLTSDEPTTDEQEAEAIAEFVESLPEELQQVVIESPLDVVASDEGNE